MAFTAYIFREDFLRLTTQEARHASQQQKGGSLFGQWTSTGNPVVHFAVSYSARESERHQMGKDFHEKFRICYIGEWRPVRAHVGNGEMQTRYRLRRHDAPDRFLVLDVSTTDIVPYLFEGQTPKGSGKMEKLQGENPFNKRNVFQPSQPTTNYNNPPRYGPGYAGYGQQDAADAWRRQDPPQPVNQVAKTSKEQWYASDRGSKTLQNVVLEEFQKIAQGRNVEMSRDTVSQNISLFFTDGRYRRKWEVQFPARFPQEGAILIENPGTHAAIQTRQAPNAKASQAVQNIISFIHRIY